MKNLENDKLRFLEILKKRDEKISSFYALTSSPLRGRSTEEEACLAVLEILNLEENSKNKMAIASRFVNLKEMEILDILKSQNLDKTQIRHLLREVFFIVRNYYEALDFALLHSVESLSLFTQFERHLLKIAINIAHKFNALFPKWLDLNVYKTADTMQERYKDQAIAKGAKSIDRDNKTISDFSFSSISYHDLDAIASGTKNIEDVASISYFDVFSEVGSIIDSINEGIKELKTIQEHAIDKDAYIAYLQALGEALGERGENKIEALRNLDRAWMQTLDFLQISHPLEYYEDIYRRSIAPEFDLRVQINSDDNFTRSNIKSFFSSIARELQIKKELKAAVEGALGKVRVFYSTPALIAGSNLNGVFSAQVVPNDEIVTKEYGKKIFAYASRIYHIAKNKPLLRLDLEVLGEAGIKDKRAILENEKDFLHVYDITTNGHEFGHILFMDEGVESAMNLSGEFKNIEEFKATCGGLVAYYLGGDGLNRLKEEDKIAKEVCKESIYRAINLLSWRGNSEVLPYFCESLIHLSLMFKSGVLTFSTGHLVEVRSENFYNLALEEIATYKSLARHYIERKDAKEFLNLYIDPKTYTPRDEAVLELLENYTKIKDRCGSEII